MNIWKKDLPSVSKTADSIITAKNKKSNQKAQRKYRKRHAAKVKTKDKERHADYYEKHRAEICEKQRIRDSLTDRNEYMHEYYEENKERIQKANSERYYNNHEERKRAAREYYQQHKEQINKRRKELRDAKRALDSHIVR